MRQWHRLPREEVDPSSLGALRVRLDVALSTYGAVGVPARCRAVGLGGLQGFLPTQHISGNLCQCLTTLTAKETFSLYLV